MTPAQKLIKSKTTQGRVAVIDIGSNTVRLVVYDTPNRLPIPIFNEKSECGLGKGLETSGKLNPEGAREALRSMTRFIGLSESMGVEQLSLVATAAVRDASDGQDFVKSIESRFGVQVEIPSGAEEAQLSALGLIMGTPRADGFLADLGGGSVDLVGLNKGVFGQTATLPLGHLRLAEAAGGDIDRAAELIESELSQLEWLSAQRRRTLYAIGGSWRALARVFIDQTSYPLHVVDGYSLARSEIVKMCDLITGLSAKTIRSISGIQKNRAKSVPYGALVLRALVERSEVSSITFSGYGMREGQLLKMLPKDLSGQDPLLSGCAGMAERTGRFAITGAELFDWMAPLFPPGRDAESRLRMAACMLSDIGWSEHPDYRAEHAFLRVLRLPFAGLTHAERVFLAIAIFIRYNGDTDNHLVKSVRALMTDYDVGHANVTGLALRLAHTVSGSAPGLLSQTTFDVTDREIVLQLPDGDHGQGDVYRGEAVERRLNTLGTALGRKGLLN
jgi:exopolyphosphatase/guanosine-5'-triphosphate,3'-diphosphate pyrophosphatase